MKKRALLSGAIKSVLCSIAIGLFVRSVASADLARTGAIIGHAGPLIVLCLLPYSIAIVVDSLAWQHVFWSLGRDVRHVRLVIVRLACEAVSMSLPAGAVLAESLTPSLLERHTSTPTSASVAAMAGKKWLTMRSHGLYVGVSAAVGFGVLSRISPPLLGRPGLPFLVIVLACVPLGLSILLQASLGRGSIAGRVHELLRAVPLIRLRAWLDERRASFAKTDSGLAQIVSDTARNRRATALYVAAWLIESLESFVILRVLGVDIGFAEVISVEAGLSVVRSMAFFAPSGIGVQDFGYVACFSAMGLPEVGAVATAFVLIKRSKELFWIAVGYGALVASAKKSASSGLPARASSSGAIPRSTRTVGATSASLVGRETSTIPLRTIPAP